jgi:hypothetical protein
MSLYISSLLNMHAFPQSGMSESFTVRAAQTQDEP